MHTFTGEQLSGAGVAGIALTAGTQYTFTMVIPTTLSGSGYFTVETVRNKDGFYDSTIATNAIGAYADLTNIPAGGHITSSYISSIVTDRNPPTAVSYKFTPTANVAVGDTIYRSTGNIGLQVNPT